MAKSLRAILLAAIATTATAAFGSAASCASFSSTSEASSDDAAAEASVGIAGEAGDDGRSPPPAPVDGAVDATSGAVLCDGGAWVCDDFDHTPTTWPMPTWEPPATHLTTGATIELTQEQSVSKPTAAAFSVAANGSPVTAQLRHSAGVSLAGVRCAFDVQLLEAGAGSLQLIDVRISGPSAPQLYRVGFLAGPSGGYFDDNGTATATAGIGLAMWTHVEVVVELGGDAQVLVGGAAQLAAGSTHPPAAGTATSNLSVAIGLDLSQPVAVRWRALYDNVRCDVH